MKEGELKKIDIDDIIARVLDVGTTGCSLNCTVSDAEIFVLCSQARTIFLSQPVLIEIEPPVKICGDTHGQYSDVLRLLDRGGFPPYSNYLFLGDYVDRGQQNLETILLFFAFKIKYPFNFFLLRGNHECPNINRVYGFFEECKRRYPYSPTLWNVFQDVFATMPLAGIVGRRILCMHGGLSPQMKSLNALRQMERLMDPPSPSIYVDLLWADPDANARGWQPNNRGVSYIFGPDVVTGILTLLDLDLVARGHQVVQDGYEFFADKKLVTIFSAPHYCGQFDNAAAMMVVDSQLMCSFLIIKPTTNLLKITIK